MCICSLTCSRPVTTSAVAGLTLADRSCVGFSVIGFAKGEEFAWKTQGQRFAATT